MINRHCIQALLRHCKYDTMPCGIASSASHIFSRIQTFKKNTISTLARAPIQASHLKYDNADIFSSSVSSQHFFARQLQGLASFGVKFSSTCSTSNNYCNDKPITRTPTFNQTQGNHMQECQSPAAPPKNKPTSFDYGADKVIQNKWQPISTQHGQNIEVSQVLAGINAVEGLAISRYKSVNTGALQFEPNDGHIISILKGFATLKVNSQAHPLTIQAGTHLYIPPGENGTLTTSKNFYAIHASGPREQAVGSQFIIRSERFARPARDILTPQYLSRRIFTHRDKTLQSKYDTRVAWFHTTMFDSSGLPANAQGDQVFKMSYDNQTEPNVVYETGGQSAVRFAQHPYQQDQNQQQWSKWYDINEETTYYLNETSDGPEVQQQEQLQQKDNNTQPGKILRNRHEVLIKPNKNERGYVSLCCLFDPGPTGLEQHQPGEYSSYGPVAQTIDTPEYQSFKASIAPIDQMIDVLSLAMAKGASEEQLQSLPEWPIFIEQKSQQIQQQQQLIDQLKTQGKGRELIVENWRLPQ